MFVSGDIITDHILSKCVVFISNGFSDAYNSFKDDFDDERQ